MYFRGKQAGRYRYVQIAESYREGPRVRQRVLATLGNLDEIEAQGGVDALVASGARFSEKVAVLDARGAGTLVPGRFVRIGPDEVCRRIWAELGTGESLRETVGARRFLFDAERAVYLTVMHRLFESGSDRSAVLWREPYRLPNCEPIELRQISRSMGWLGSPLADQAGCTALGPHCVKDLVEELQAANMDFEWAQVIASLREVQEAEADFSGRPVVIRSEMAGCSAHLFRTVGAPIPPAVRFPQPGGAEPGSVVLQPSRRSVTQ